MLLNNGRSIRHAGAYYQYRHFKKFVYELSKKSKLTEEVRDEIDGILSNMHLALKKNDGEKYQDLLNSLDQLLPTMRQNNPFLYFY